MSFSRILFIAIVLTGFIGCGERGPVVNFNSVDVMIQKGLKEAVKLTDSIDTEELTFESRLKLFKEARAAFKKVEPFAALVNSEAALRVNGPPLPVFREDNNKVLPAVGLQAIEELVLEEDSDFDELQYKVQITVGYLNLLNQQAESFKMNPKRYFLAIHQQLLRIYSLGLTGFDTPGTFWGLEESAKGLQNIAEVYELAIGDTIQLLNTDLHDNFLKTLESASDYITTNSDFETFDRYHFGREYLNPLTSQWVNIRKTAGLWDDPKIYGLNLDAESFFAQDAFNLEFFRSTYNRKPSSDQIELGRKLFFDNRLSASGKLSCGSCHNPSNVYQDGLITGLDKDDEPLLRNTPTIINTVFQKKFFWDGRSDNLEQQITSVFDNSDEFDNRGHQISSEEILDDKMYQDLFVSAYPNKEFDKNQIIRAISSYTSTLNAMNSRFDRNMRGELDDFTEDEILGMNLYMGKALCATCHFVPLTNGTVPPSFKETEKEILGTPETAENVTVDNDLGFYWVFQEDIHKYMFKTPTVRNVEYTAPYMHNGVYETLEQVMDFYNKGGGGGMGFDLPHQTLPFDSLSLSVDEQNAIIAFMKTLSDTTVVKPQVM